MARRSMRTVLLAIDGIQSAHRFVSEQCFVTNAFALPHVVVAHRICPHFPWSNRVG